MKTIGLNGGTTWISTVDYYACINKEINRSLGGVHSAKLLLYSLNFDDFRKVVGLKAEMAEMFATAALKLQVAGAECIIDDAGVYTSGGATAFLNLCLYLVEKFCGRETAVLTSKMLLLDLDKTRQSKYSMFVPQMSHNDDQILRAQKIIETVRYTGLTPTAYRQKYKRY